MDKSERKGKFYCRSVEGVLFGFGNGNGYRIFCPEKNIIIESRDIMFLKKCDAQPDHDMEKHLIQCDKTESELIFDDVSRESREEEDVLE